MAVPKGYKSLQGTEHRLPRGHKVVRRTRPDEPITVTLIVRRRNGEGALRSMKDFVAPGATPARPLSRAEFGATNGANPDDLATVAQFARDKGLSVLESHLARRSVVMRGPAAAVNYAFGIALHDYDCPRGRYHGHAGRASLPGPVAAVVEAVIGLTNRQVPAQHYSTARRQNPNDPPGTTPLSPQQVAALYAFPSSDGAGQTIGIYEMQTSGGAAGYTTADLTQSIAAFGGGLAVPVPVDVAVDGVQNSGVSDGETGLDITVAGAIAQKATIAVYFTGGDAQSILHALQRMIHPDAGDPVPTILSISYGWGPDDPGANSFSAQEFTQFTKLFQDAANLSVTVLVSSGDSGAYIESPTQAQTSYPASDPWVTACGGTTVGNIGGGTFAEYVWNDSGAAGPGATGGGVSARFAVPAYQANAKVPTRNGTKTSGRGVPDIAGNASENSGYLQVINGQRAQPVGGTSAVAPLYAGLVARINADLGFSAGFLNPVLYALPATTFRRVPGAPGPTNNSYGKVVGYPAGPAWDACTGLGSVRGSVLEAGIKAARGGSGAPPGATKK